MAEEGYSLKDYFGGKGTEEYKKYKKGQKAGKWADLPAYIAGKEQRDFQAGIAKQKAEEESFFKNLQSTIAGQEKAGDIFSRVGEQFGLSEKRGRAEKLYNELKALPEKVATHGRNFGMSSSQIARRAEALAAKKAPSYEEAERAAIGAATGARELAGYEIADRERGLRHLVDRIPSLRDRWAREVTGFTMQAQRELDNIAAKIQRGHDVSMAELNLASQIALKEKDYEIKQRGGGDGTNLQTIFEPKSEPAGSGAGGNRNAILENANAFEDPLGSTPINYGGNALNVSPNQIKNRAFPGLTFLG